MVGFESVFLHSPNKGFWVCLGDSPPGMPRRSKVAPLSSGQIVPRVTTDQQLRVTPIIPRVRHNVKHSIAGCFKATTANISAYTVVTLHWQCLHWYESCIGTAVERMSQGTPLAINQWSTSGTKTLFICSLPHPCHLLHNIMFYRHIVLFLL